MKTCLSVLLVVCSCPLLAQQPLFDNLDFAQGTAGWSDWSGATAHRWEVEPAAGPAAKPALRIDAASRQNNVMVLTASNRLQPGERYAFEVYWKLDGMSRRAQVDFRVIYRGPDEKWLSGTDLYPISSQPAGAWTVKQYRASVPPNATSTTLGIWVRDTTGTIRVANIAIEHLPKGEKEPTSMLLYDPHLVELGRAPLEGFHKLKEGNSPFLSRAMRWNRLLVDVAFLQEDMARARRAKVYGSNDDAPLDQLSAAVDALARKLDELQLAYGRCFLDERPDDLERQFDPVASELESRVGQVRSAIAECIGACRPKQGAADARWCTIPNAPEAMPWWDARKGRPRYLLWNRWSTSAFRFLEAPLRLGDMQTLTAGYPKSCTDGVCDWSNYLDQASEHYEAGARRFSLITHYSLHDKGYLSAEFARQHADTPDIYLWDKEGKPIGPKSGLCNINWLNPDVRRHMVDVLTQMATFFKDRSEYLFYVTSWESAGPYCGNLRVGGNPSHRAAFQAYLRRRYGNIATLNQEWGSDYAGLDQVAPVAETPTPVGEPGSALLIESQRWAQEAYVDYLSLIRDTLRAVDPTKPIVGEHSGLLSNVIDPRVTESVDILGYHRRARTTMAVQLWMSSLQRYTGKSTGLFENFWGCQEDHPRRMSDEKAMRAQLRRYLYRHAAWGRCMQTWWYAYTSAAYLTSYNCNWFNPLYDLTTFRYAAGGLPVEKAKVDRIQALLLESTIVPSRTVLIQPVTTMLAQGRNSAVWHEWLEWHQLLFPRNLLYEALPDTWFADGRARLSDFSVVILPLATHLDKRFIPQLLSFLHDGGLAIASGPCAQFDELGRETRVLWDAMTPALTAKRDTGPSEDWRFSFGQPELDSGWVELGIGRGKLILLPESIATLDEAEADTLAARISTPSTPAAEAPGSALELLLRRLDDGRCLLCVLNRDPDTTATADVWVKGHFRQATDIDIQPPFPVPVVVESGRTKISLTLDPGATTYILLTDKE